MQYMIKNYDTQHNSQTDNSQSRSLITNSKKEYLQELKNYRQNLEWLLEVYQGSMDEDVL